MSLEELRAQFLQRFDVFVGTESAYLFQDRRTGEWRDIPWAMQHYFAEVHHSDILRWLHRTPKTRLEEVTLYGMTSQQLRLTGGSWQATRGGRVTMVCTPGDAVRFALDGLARQNLVPLAANNSTANGPIHRVVGFVQPATPSVVAINANDQAPQLFMAVPPGQSSSLIILVREGTAHALGLYGLTVVRGSSGELELRPYDDAPALGQPYLVAATASNRAIVALRPN